MNIAIDIGHANNTGTRGNGLEEHDQVAKIATVLSSKLRFMGHSVVVIDYPKLTNTQDLNATIKSVYEGNYDLGISLHCDASENINAKGAHVCYTSNKGLFLASLIALPLCALLPGRANKTVKRNDLAILNKTKPVWVLVECGFITSIGDSKVIDKGKESIADAIAEGIHHYSKNN